MHSISLADELAELRSEIARLKLREAAVRTVILSQPDKVLTGRWAQVVVEARHYTAFDPNLLPEAIRADQGFWRAREVQVLRTLPVQAKAAPRPGWPIRREAAALH